VTAPQNVLLNALFLAPGESGGPETYLRGLAPALAREYPNLRITLLTTPSGGRALAAEGWEEFLTLSTLPSEDGQRLRRLLSEQVRLPLRARRGVDVVHSLASVSPVFAGAADVVTLHDVTFLREPTFGRVTTTGMGVLMAIAARNADALITGSHAAAQEICTRLEVAPSRFTVVHHGYAPRNVLAPTPEAELRARYGLGDARLVVCVAAKRPHKNQELLIRALPSLDPDIALVLAGHAEAYEQELRELARELGLAERVHFVGYLPDADLEGLWRSAACCALPTLGEGFGIPVLEALAHGVPLACSDLPVLREVGGALPSYFDPRDPSDAARAIRAALSDTATAAEGPPHAAGFTWEASAHGTHEAYERALRRTR
jgi:glycosyltransferase involved in cell wall biosynthesis